MITTDTALPDGVEYTGDVDIARHGGLFYRYTDFEDGYADFIRITDLDSATGARGKLLIEHGSAYLDPASFADALRFVGSDLDGLEPITRHCLTIEAMIDYGSYDLAGYGTAQSVWGDRSEFDIGEDDDSPEWRVDVWFDTGDDIEAAILEMVSSHLA